MRSYILLFIVVYDRVYHRTSHIIDSVYISPANNLNNNQNKTLLCCPLRLLNIHEASLKGVDDGSYYSSLVML